MKRKGARSMALIPQTVINQLNKGETESVNLVESLAIDSYKLAQHYLKKWNRTEYLPLIKKNLNDLIKISAITKSNAVARGLMFHYKENNDLELLELLSKEQSDRAREWACFLIGKDDKRSLTSKLKALKKFADDEHFGVRESAWFAVRDHIVIEPENAIELLSKWTINKSANIRRFASEASRPRGVWCAHIEMLKKNPEPGMKILEPLKNDSSKYVRDSVGNWLNDAGKTNADWLLRTCKRWKKESPNEGTLYILKKALRNIK